MDFQSRRQLMRRLVFHSPQVARAMLTGEFRSAFKGRGIDFDGLREYDATDDALRIDWNATVRQGHPFVKTYIDDRGLSVYLVVDASLSMGFGSGRSKYDTAALSAALLVTACQLNNLPVGGLLFGVPGGTGSAFQSTSHSGQVGDAAAGRGSKERRMNSRPEAALLAAGLSFFNQSAAPAEVRSLVEGLLAGGNPVHARRPGHSGYQVLAGLAARLAGLVAGRRHPPPAARLGNLNPAAFDRRGRRQPGTPLAADAAPSAPVDQSGSPLAEALQAAGLRLKKKSLVLVFSDFLVKGYARELALLARRHDVVCVLLKDALDEAPPPGRLLWRVRDAESARPALLVPAEADYRDQWAAVARERRLDWLGAVRTARVASLELDGNCDPALSLISFFDRRRRGRYGLA
ncbi:MAG TPA: hypothetical protein DCX65_10345 [Spirochaetaceae bacterium]|nr:hypothetical protein [Spirochaetaceae bacterium]